MCAVAALARVLFMNLTTNSKIAINVTTKGQGDIPVRPKDTGSTEAIMKTAEAYISGLEDMSRCRPFRGFSTEGIMEMTRGED